MLVGSANLTTGAMKENSEIMLHVSSGADAASKIKEEILEQISDYWNMGEVATDSVVKKYRDLRKIQRPAFMRISGTYSSKKRGATPMPIDTEIMFMTWSRFYRSIQKHGINGIDDRCRLLDFAHDTFQENESFSRMSADQRKIIAGLTHDTDINHAWFGTMGGHGDFAHAISENNSYISKALDHIPLVGAINRDHYNSYVKEFNRAFPKRRRRQKFIGTTSRLLAMKRPDQFVCLNRENKKNICEEFGIKRTHMTYDRYWEDLICRIHDSVWWNSPRPKNRMERRVWEGRVAMLDAIFYEGG